MNFFSWQDVARKRTWELAFLFFFAAALEIAGIALIAGTVFVIAARIELKDVPATLIGFLIYGSPIGLAILIAAFISRHSQMRRGGYAIAEMMGGDRLPDAPDSLPERTLRNVVQEIAVAASIPPPAIYVLRQESAINAFAAGEAGKDAIIAVTRGAIDKLTRDELQGVIAHEFSHILNHDTRLNRRTLSVVYALSCVLLVGIDLLRLCAGGKKGIRVPTVAVFVFGAAMAFVGLGLFGGFLGRLVRAAVTRQRETLADASSVQFTRNPQAIASALYKVANENQVLNHFRAEEMNHFLFVEDTNSAWHKLGFLDTHPPIRNRIRAVDPGFLAKQFAWNDNPRRPLPPKDKRS
jgi:Zn-dependent protease with chaperone function